MVRCWMVVGSVLSVGLAGRRRRGRLVFGHEREDAIDDLENTLLFVHLNDFNVGIEILVQEIFNWN